MLDVPVQLIRRLTIGALALSAIACGAERVDAPPANPAITNQAAPPDSQLEMPLRVECDGPDEELRVLGAVCGADTAFLGWVLSDGPGMATAIGPLDGPFLMLFARLGYEPDYRKNVASELDYSAYFVREGAGEDTYETLDQWPSGDAVTSGTVITHDAYFVACSQSWRGEGTFLWRSTTIRFAWEAAQGC